jgi:hypothetical protein
MNDEIDINAPATDSPAYDDLIKDAERDDAIGAQEFLVSEVINDEWPSGDPRLKLKGNLTSVGSNPKADLTISPPPPPDVLKAESATYEQGKKRAIANTINLYKQLGQHYGKSPQQIREGDTFKVQVVRTKRNPDNTGGFLRIVAFLPKEHAVGADAAKATTAGSSPF